jgi:hypothetical protein
MTRPCWVSERMPQRQPAIQRSRLGTLI